MGKTKSGGPSFSLSALERLEAFRKTANVGERQQPFKVFLKNNEAPKIQSARSREVKSGVTLKTETSHNGLLGEYPTWDIKGLQLSKMPSMTSLRSTRVDTECMSGECSSMSRFR